MKKLQISKDVALPVDAVTERLGFFGQSGSGKTYAAMRLAELMLEVGAQIVCIDPVGPWWGLRSAADGKRAGFAVIVFGGVHGDVPITPQAGALIADLIVDKEISAVVDVSDFTISEMHSFVIDFAERFFDRKKRKPTPVHLFLEEAHTFIPQNLPPDPRAATMLNRVERIVRVGRNHGIGSTQISQMPQSVNTKARNQVSTLFAMRTIGKHERKAIADWMADKATGEHQLDLDSLLKTLDTGEAWIASPHWLKVFEKTRITAKTTFDSSATPKFGVKLEPPKVLAAVDVEALRTAMAAVVVEAEKDDPAPLRKRIRELETELARAKAHPIAVPKVETKIVEVPAFPPEQMKALTDALQDAASKTAAVEAIAHQLLAHAKTLSPRRSGPHVTSGPPRPQPTRRLVTRSQGDTSELGSGERAVLTAVAQHEAGVTREQLTVLTGYKRSSRDTYLQRLKASGLVTQNGETITVTGDGLEALGADFEPLPTGDALYQHWLQRLAEGERRVLEIVAAAYPAAIERERISDETGYKRSSRDTYLQRLSARKLVESTGRSQVRASEQLFS